MASTTIGFSIPEEDTPRLDRLVQKFGRGNRSAFLRAAMRYMEILDRAEQLDALADYGGNRLTARGLTADDVPGLVKEVLRRPR